MFAAGSRYENAQNRGIAHFAEHMFFKGTERRPSSRDLTTLIDGIGGEFNAFTSQGVHGLLRPLRGRRPRHRARRARST